MGADPGVDTNLQGQKLGRKGRITRQRILTAARELIEDPETEDFSISAVARRAELRVSSIYNYFPDLPDLFLTVLEPIIAETQVEHLAILERFWPDDTLGEDCRAFVQAFHSFWKRNVRLLHMRNAMADKHEQRVLSQRILSARQVVNLLGQQMGGPKEGYEGPEYDLASVLYTGLERVVTIATDELLKAHYPPHVQRRFGGATLVQQGRLLELAIRDERARIATEG
ncbi:TetR/AcrR family transcriptional regulator [Erythrobacter alti]|uniref:TetR/AcrR family transcriptional regulator n=1 Tax=Erythrobacter alti TaxID=1896145 RepID=UPI0030F43A40